MKPEHGYIKTIIGDTPYLLPYGQQIADHRPGMRFNTSGSLLWDALCQNAGEEELLSVLKNHYSASEEELPALKEDLARYLKMLSDHNLLIPEKIPSPVPASYEKTLYFQIGPLKLEFCGADKIFTSCFQDFSCEGGSADQRISFHYGRPRAHRNGEILVRNETVIISADSTSYILIFPGDSRLFEVHIRKDGSTARIYCMPPLGDQLTQMIFHAIRFSLLVLAQQRGLYMLHSASMMYKDQAWLFSGKSGTGKSTHTALWQSHYQTPVLNGDLNLIGIENRIPMVYGIPWCGTSGIYTAKKYPLGGIVFLKQAPREQVLLPSEADKALLLTQRMISPSWTPSLLLQNLDFAQTLLKIIPAFQLFCTKEPSAAALMKQTIDHYLKKENEHHD